MTDRKAYEQKKLDQADANIKGREQILFRMEPPYLGHEYIVASAANVPYSGAEVYLFPADRDGEITDWVNLDGSERGTLNIDRVLHKIGYEIEPADA